MLLDPRTVPPFELPEEDEAAAAPLLTPAEREYMAWQLQLIAHHRLVSDGPGGHTGRRTGVRAGG